MGKNRDYTKFSKPKVKEAVVKPEEIQNGVTEEVVEPVTVVGVVVDCQKLNIRKEPNAEAEILGTISVGSEVTIDESESNENFYKVCTAAGAEGFCMKKFISVK